MIPKEQRIAIAKEIVDGSLSSREAAEKYGISKSLAADVCSSDLPMIRSIWKIISQ